MTKKLEASGGANAGSFLPFSRPSITAADISAVADVLKSGWITTGQVCAELEQRFAKLTGCRYAVAMSSATAGMHLLLHALGIGPGDEVITPSMTWVSTVNLITLTGATPVFVDVDRETLMTTADAVKTAVTKRTKLIIPVHFAGATLDLGSIRAVADQHNIRMIEDAAHAAGSEYRGNAIGGTGTAVFSLHPIKNLTTGEGGIVCTDSAATETRLRSLRFHGLRADTYQRETQGRAPQAEVVEPGFKYNLPDMNAALGVSQLMRLAAMNRKRRLLAEHYLALLADIDGVTPLSFPAHDQTHAWHLFVVRIDAEIAGLTRDDFMARLKARGIGTGLHFRAVHTHAFYRSTPLRHPLPNTEWNTERICSLPLFPDMQLADVERVVTTIRSVLREA